MTFTAAELAPIPLFAGLTDDELAAWAEVAQERWYEPGDLLWPPGAYVPLFLLLVEGRLDGIRPNAEGTPEVDHQHVAPTWLGAIPVLTENASPLTMRAAEPSRLGAVEPDEFRRLIFAQPSVFRTIMQTFRPVIAQISATEARREKLASLGTMAAGLAHELNNPAAAAKRSAAELADALDTVTGTLRAFVSSGVEREEAERLIGLHDAAIARSCELHDAPPDPLGASDREERLLELLEDRGVEEAWKLAEPLSVAGVDEAWLVAVAEHAGSATPAALRWVAASLTARALVDELRESADRMSSLVAAMKTYAYMDQGSLQEIDVHEGLEATLKILGHKLKQTEITIMREYGAALPRVCVYGSELNQVWTNLLDNAIGALGSTGTITLRTRPWNGDGVEVEIADDGPGVPRELQGQVFDPFFTTKAVGEGTGMGLDTVRRIVVGRHQGDVQLESAPGSTVFRVRLPHAPRRAAP